MTGSNGPALTPDQVHDRIGLLRLIAVIRSTTKDHALQVSRLLLGAGVKALEITFTTPEAPDVIATLRSEVGAGVVLGAGTIRSAEDAHCATDSGADFLVSPGSSPDLVEAMLATGRLVLPGVVTPTEVMHARLLGVSAVKLFPASMVGPEGLRALRGPFPDMAFVPTGGITTDAVPTWLDAGAHAVGIGSSLAPPSLRGGAQERELTSHVRQLLGATMSGPGERSSTHR